MITPNSMGVNWCRRGGNILWQNAIQISASPRLTVEEISETDVNLRSKRAEANSLGWKYHGRDRGVQDDCHLRQFSQAFYFSHLSLTLTFFYSLVFLADINDHLFQDIFYYWYEAADIWVTCYNIHCKQFSIDHPTSWAQFWEKITKYPSRTWMYCTTMLNNGASMCYDDLRALGDTIHSLSNGQERVLEHINPQSILFLPEGSNRNILYVVQLLSSDSTCWTITWTADTDKYDYNHPLGRTSAQ